MVQLKNLGNYPMNIPKSIHIEGVKTVTEVMTDIIASCGMPESFFWDRHFVLLNGKRPEMDDTISDGDKIEIVSFCEGG